MGPEGGEVEFHPMEADAAFFGGTVEAEVLLARAGMNWTRPGLGKVGSGEAEHGRGGFRGGMGGRYGGERGEFGGERERGEGREGGGEREQEGGEESGGARIYAMNERPLVLRVRLTNHGKMPVKVAVVDFNSVLGDFAVQPESIAVDPGQSVEAEPMVSRLGYSGAEIPLTVQLRVDGKTEQKVLQLHPIKPPGENEAAPPSPATPKAP